MYRVSSLLLLALAVVAMANAPMAGAAAQRTFVASFGAPGNTAFNCSITKPCRAFSEAIGVTTTGGEVLVLDSAGYGPVTITKSVSLVAPPGIYAGISVFSGNGIDVNAPGAIVVLRGLSINGQGGDRGIRLQAAARVRIENCVVSGMAIAGIVHNAPSAEMIILDTVVRDHAGSGIAVVGDALSAVLDRVRVEHNGGQGLGVGPIAGSLGVRATVIDSVFAHNEGSGIRADAQTGTTVTIVVERSVLSYNGQDGVAVRAVTGAAVAAFARNTVNDNGGNGVLVHGNSSGTAFENALHRNGADGIRADGGARVLISANAANHHNSGVDFRCDQASGATLISLGNNLYFAGSGGTCHQVGGGY